MRLVIPKGEGVRSAVKTLPVWLMIIPLAMLNGMARDCLMQPLLGVFALPVSGLTLCVLVLTLTWLFVPRLGIKDLRQLALVGLVWAFLAIVFECLLALPWQVGLICWLLMMCLPATCGCWLWSALGVPWLAAKMRGLA